MELKQINELTKIAYNKTADKYHQHFKNEIEQKEYDRLLLDRYSNMLMANSLICDAGCGPSGHIGKYLFDKGHRVVGIDISQRCIDIATSYNSSMDFKVMDIMNTDFENETFDGIISFYSIIYTPKKHIDKIFSEFNRILKRSGKLLLVVKKGITKGIIDDEWIWNNFFRVGIKWIKEHRSLESNKSRIMKLYIPVYLFHGTYDANCPVEGVIQIQKNAQELNKENIHVFIFPDHNHSLEFLSWVVRKSLPEGLKILFEEIEKL